MGEEVGQGGEVFNCRPGSNRPEDERVVRAVQQPASKAGEGGEEVELTVVGRSLFPWDLPAVCPLVTGTTMKYEVLG